MPVRVRTGTLSDQGPKLEPKAQTILVPQLPQNLPPEVFSPQVGQFAGAACTAGLPHSGQNFAAPTSAPHWPQRCLAAWVLVTAVGAVTEAPADMSTWPT